MSCVRETRRVRTRVFDRVRGIVLALPGVSERVSHGEPCFFVSRTRALCYYHDNHNGDGRVSLWCPAPPGVQDELVNAEPRRFFIYEQYKDDAALEAHRAASHFLQRAKKELPKIADRVEGHLYEPLG